MYIRFNDVLVYEFIAHSELKVGVICDFNEPRARIIHSDRNV